MRFDLTVNEFTKELTTRGRLAVYGEQFWRPYVHVRDIARAVELVLTTDVRQVHRGVFNVGSNGQNFTKGQLVEKIRTAVGKGEIERVHRDEDPRDYRVDFSRIEQELGFKATRSVEDGIREVRNALRLGVFGDPDDPRYRN